MQHNYRFFNLTISLAVFILVPLLSFSQSIVITGKVTDAADNSSLPGVAIVIKKSANGTQTDFDGKYSITAKKGDSLEFSFIGYNKVIKVVGDQKVINVKLFESTTVLNEVVIVGYGTATKKELTGATAVVKGEEISKLNVPRMDQALQGQVSGVVINTNSGSPGGGSSIRIRGLSTFGDNDPLILVDGIVYDSEGLNALNPSDIESINVLKGKDALQAYGKAGKNGVIQITLKK